MSRNMPPAVSNQQTIDIRSAVPSRAPEKATGLPPEGHVGVYVHGGKTLVGHVVRGSQATAARFGSHFAKLGKVAGRDALDWQDARRGFATVHHERLTQRRDECENRGTTKWLRNRSN